MTPIQVKLRELRERAGLSQRDLSVRAGVRQAAISHLETGRAQRIDLNVMERLCKALSCDPADLLNLTPGQRKRRR